MVAAADLRLRQGFKPVQAGQRQRIKPASHIERIAQQHRIEPADAEALLPHAKAIARVGQCRGERKIFGGQRASTVARRVGA